MKPSFKDVMEALKSDDNVTVNRLIKEGFDLTETDSSGSTILMWASQRREKCVRTLLTHKPPINHKNDAGVTALMWAVRWKRGDIVRMLINGGADINAADDKGYTVLMMAVTERATDIVKLLLERGVDTEARNDNGLSALDLLEFDGRTSTLALKDMIEMHRQHANGTAAQEKAVVQEDIVALKVRQLKQRAPRVRLKF